MRRSLAASFLVYLLPLVGPHFVSLWGIVLWAEVTRGERESAWLACDLALAILLQIAALILFLAAGRLRGALRYVVPLLAAPLFMAYLDWTYMIAIPTRFLIEEVDLPEKTDWPVACTVEDAWIAPVRAGAGLALERAEVAFIHRGRDVWATLRMPGCEVRDLVAVETGAPRHVSPEGAMLFHLWDRAAQKDEVFVLAAGAGELESVDPPDETRPWYPLLSADGSAIAWLASTRTDDGRGFEYRVHRRNRGTNEESSIRLPEEYAIQPQLVGFDVSASELALAFDLRSIVGLDLEGRLSWGPFAPLQLDHVAENFVHHPGGFVAWDAYREKGRYRVVFELPSGEGVHEIPKGRSISSISLDPDGRFIALSTSPSLSIGNVADAVYVFSVESGEEVYRRALPAYSRSEVSFLGPRFLAVTRIAEGKSFIEVLSAPLPPSGR
jgi:hypothetical protein